MEKKYLYYNFFNRVNRCQVTKETDSNIWVLLGKREVKISKKTYRTGSGFNVTYYWEETPELLESWEKQKFNELFLRALKLLEKNKDIPDNIKKCVIDMAKQIENKG